MAQLKAGSRLKSAVCTTEVIVIMAPPRDVDVRCGGHPMLDAGASAPDGLALDAAAAQGTALGKRYVDADGTLEVLCTKPGKGSLGLGTTLLTTKEAKPLPSSD